MNRLWAAVGSTALVAGLIVGITPAPAQANGAPKEWFIAQSGTANPNGASCADPTVVGSDDTAIRTVLNAVSADDTVTICDGVYTITQTLMVDDSITIRGESTANSILDGGNAVQIMRINDDDSTPGDPLEVEVSVTDLTFRNGNTGNNGDTDCNALVQCGGAIYVEHQSDLTVLRSYFLGNYASFQGGAIANGGEQGVGSRIRIEGSTFQDNIGQVDAGAFGVVGNNGVGIRIANNTFFGNRAIGRSGGSVSINFSDQAVVAANTFVGDRAGDQGQSIYANAIVSMQGNLIASGGVGNPCALSIDVTDDSSVSTGPGCATAQVVTRDSLNLLGLGYWGGPTQTVWIGPGSSAENANGGVCEPLDQRGATRSAAPCDAGAFERRGPTAEATTGSLDYPTDVPLLSAVSPVSSPGFSGVGRTVGYESLTTTQCAVDQATGAATGQGLGVCGVRWYLAPTLTTDGATQDDTLTVVKAAQATLAITSGSGPLAPDDTVTLTTSGGSGSGAITFSASPASVCSVTGTTLTALDYGTCEVSATKAGDDTYFPATSPTISIAIPAPNPPTPVIPPSSPRDASAEWTGGAVRVTWQGPETPGSFPVSTYQVVSQPSGGSCLVPDPALACEISGLTPGRTYTFTVRALNGGGWSPYSAPSGEVTIPRQPDQSIMITGSRAGKRVMVEGRTQGVSAGTNLAVWVRVGPRTDFTRRRLVAVEPDGTVTWQRRAVKSVRVYVSSLDGQTRSNTVRISRRS